MAGIARHEYKQGWKSLTLGVGYGVSEATWEPMSAFEQPDAVINPIVRSYLMENNDCQLLTRAETCPGVRRKTNHLVPIYLLLLTELTELHALGGGGTFQTFSSPVWGLLRDSLAGV